MVQSIGYIKIGRIRFQNISMVVLGDVERGIAILPKGAFAELFGVAFQKKDGESE